MQQSSTTAKAWIVMDADSQVYIRGHNTQQKREIASITKMYTLYASLILNKLLSINPQSIFLQIFPSPVAGTLANLIPNQYISILDLYYALMLPSGNDAACILAFYYGGWLVTKKTFINNKNTKKQSYGDKGKYYQLFTKKFIQFLNNIIVKQELNHTHTHFQNCHGLSDKNQVSNVWELAEASLKFIKNETFKQIINSKVYRGRYYESQLQFQWQNTNVLLNEGYKGLKTGYTTTAGGCLSSIIELKVDKYQTKNILIVVLGSKDRQTRFIDTRILVAQHQRYLRLMKL